MKSKLTVFATLALSIHYAHAVERAWADIAGNTDWTTGSSWVGGVAPANNLTEDIAIFNSVTNAQPNLPAITRSVTGIDFRLSAGGANFTSAAGAVLRLGNAGIDATTQLSGTSTVSVESLQINGGSHTWTLFSSTNTNSTSTFTVSSNIDLNGSDLTVRSNRATAFGNVGIVNLGGVISGSANLTFSSPSASRNTINLTGDSSYTGTTSIAGMSVTANSLANVGFNSALGSSGTVLLGSNASFARLTFQDLSADSSTDRLLSLKGTATSGYTLANNDADNTISFTNAGSTGDVNVTTDNDLIFVLGGTNTGNNTFGQIINDRSGAGVTILRKNNPGTWVLTATNTYTGGTEVDGGTLVFRNTAAKAPSGTHAFAAGTTLGLGVGGSGFFGSDDITSAFAGGTMSPNLANVTVTGTTHVGIDTTAGDFTHSSDIAGSPSKGLRKLGNNTLTLTGNNTYTGGTEVKGGTLVFGNTAAKAPSGTHVFAAGTTLGLGVGGSGFFNSTDITSAFAGGTMSTNLGNVTVTGTTNVGIDTTAGDFTHSSDIAGSPSKGLRKLGNNTLTLTGNNTYTGPTTINSGSLVIDGSITSNVTVTDGGTLGGSGIITGNITVNSGGTHNAGNSPGIQTVNGNVTYSAGSIFEWDLNDDTTTQPGTAPYAFDQVAASGTGHTLSIDGTEDTGAIFRIVLGNGVNLEDAFWSTPFITQTWNNIFGGFALAGGFDTSNIEVTGQNIASYGSFSISGTTLIWTAVPEPTSALAGLLLTAGLLRRRRRYVGC